MIFSLCSVLACAVGSPPAPPLRGRDSRAEELKQPLSEPRRHQRQALVLHLESQHTLGVLRCADVRGDKHFARYGLLLFRGHHCNLGSILK